MKKLLAFAMDTQGRARVRPLLPPLPREVGMVARWTKSEMRGAMFTRVYSAKREAWLAPLPWKKDEKTVWTCTLLVDDAIPDGYRILRGNEIIQNDDYILWRGAGGQRWITIEDAMTKTRMDERVPYYRLPRERIVRKVDE